MVEGDGLRERIAEINAEALFADGLDGALIGYVRRFGMEPVALYDYAKVVEILIERGGGSYEEAVEFAEFNILGAWVGEGTPAFAVLASDSEEGPRREDQED